MPNDRSPVRDTRQDTRSLLRIIDDQIKRIFDCLGSITRKGTPAELMDEIIREYSQPSYNPWNRTNAELFGKSPIKTYTREEQSRFEQEYACNFVAPYPINMACDLASRDDNMAIVTSDVLPDENAIVSCSSHAPYSSLYADSSVRVRADETIARGNPVVVSGRQCNRNHPSPTSPKMRLEALEWQRRAAEADFTLTFKCRLPETDQILTGRMTLPDVSFASLRELFDNWPGIFFIVIDRNLEFKILDENDHEITHLKLDAFGVEDSTAGMIRCVDPTTILASPHIRGVARTNPRTGLSNLIAQIPVPHLILNIDVLDQVIGMPSHLYGESSVAPLRKQKYPPMACALCEDPIDEPENLSEFLGPRQTVKYLKACKQLNQQPQLYCCHCFKIIKSHPKFLDRYTKMMKSYEAFKKAEAQARKAMK